VNLLLVLASAFAAAGGYGETSLELTHQFVSESGLGVLSQSAPQLANQQASGGGPTTIPEMWGAWCARCHAPDGTGKIAEPTVTVQPMDFTDCKLTTAEPDADWERAIAKGGPGVGLSPQMPAFEDSLAPEQIRGFVSHMRGFCTDTGWANGNTNFPRPIITEKAFPENEFLILPAVSHEDNVEITALYEQRLGKRSMFELGLPFQDDGLEKVEIAFKHALHSNHTNIVSLGLETAIFKDTAVFEPFISAGAMLRDWYVQGHVKVELPVDTTKKERAFVYNAYFGRDTGLAPTTWTLGIELNGENHEIAITPQVRKGLTGTGALAASIGATVPLNEREERGVRWVGYLLWEYLEPWRARK
jgi:mono/diheme cytochrome c family protein